MPSVFIKQSTGEDLRQFFTQSGYDEVFDVMWCPGSRDVVPINDPANTASVAYMTYFYFPNRLSPQFGTPEAVPLQVEELAMGRWITRQLVIDALNMAVKNECLESGLIHHSDRGVQYASNEFQSLLKTHAIQCRMSRKGDCWDNAVAESFFHTLKVELTQGRVYYTRQEAKTAIFEYIEVFYNRQRRHSYLGYQSPVDFEKKNAA